MKAKAMWLVIVTAFVVAACEGLGQGEVASQDEFDALAERVRVLDSILSGHRVASQTWGWRVRTNVNCLQQREYGFSAPVRDRDSTIVDCSLPPIDPPTTPPPNNNW